ncbi:fluoride efflux transporter FluC [Stieleria varia]|uniref:Fluoride-specific ion channel FluC n=1 Tax=Stieleria varia TaxID=2528005 RepID=A0A5C5ZYE1_9BACT|nr:CrcB family protein [Stieleria varia]TWT92028.1 putative fluoride ion transporter CrcB [Stieleria varia]
MSSWLNLTAIALGGAAGAVCRYGITLAASAVPGGSSLWGTTIANVLGCAILGGVIGWVEAGGVLAERASLALRVGFLGSLTTFSTFAADSSLLAQQGRWGGSGIYVFANLVVGWAVLMISCSWIKGWAG